jgi:hypothetical protein
MAPTPPLLNATCVALQTIDYLSNCSFIPPPEKDHLAWWKVFWIVVGTLLGVGILCTMAADMREFHVLDKLWRTPTEELPNAVQERLFSSGGFTGKRQRCRSDFERRIKSSKCEIDERRNLKTITIVEDLSKIPSAKLEDYILPAERLNGGAAAPAPAPAGKPAPVTVTTTVTTTTTTEVRRETPPVTGSGSGGMVASGSSTVGTGPAPSGENGEDDAPPAYPH